MRDDVSTPTPVVNLLIWSNQGGHSSVLIGVRRPETNARHPGVVSLPTMRMPASLTPQLDLGIVEEHEFYHPHDGEWFSFGLTGTRPLIPFLAEGLFCRKLAAADLLELGRLTGRCSLRMISKKHVEDPAGTAVDEHTLMFTIVVILDGQDVELPRQTASYTEIQWVDPDLLVHAWERRDAQVLMPEYNPFEICIRGLCIQSGVELIRAMSPAHAATSG